MTAVGFCELAALSRKVSGRPSAAGWSRIGKSARILAASKVRGRVGAITAIVFLRGVTLCPPSDGPSDHRTGSFSGRRPRRTRAGSSLGYAGVRLLFSFRPPSRSSRSHYGSLVAGPPRAEPTEQVTAL